MYSDLVVLTDGWSISEVSGDVLAREQAEQEELCDTLSRLYDVIRPEEEKVRLKGSF